MNGNATGGNATGGNATGGNSGEEDPKVAMIKMMMNMGDLFKPTIMLSVAKRVRLINYTRYCEYFAEIPAMNTELNDKTFDDFHNVVLLARYIKASFRKPYYELLIEYLQCLEFDFAKPMRTEKGTGKSRGSSGFSGPGFSASSLLPIGMMGGGDTPKEAYVEEYRQLAKFQFGFENPPPKPAGMPNGPRCREGFMDKYLFYPYVKYKCKVKNPLIEKLPFKLDYFLIKNLVKLVAGLSEDFITKFIAFTSEPSTRLGSEGSSELQRKSSNQNGNKNGNKNKNKEPENLVENEGNEDREEDARGVQERIYNFLDMINELSIFQLDLLVVIARRSFSVPIPPNIGGLKFKAVIMGLMIIFKPRGFGKIVKEKLSGAERDMLRIPLGENDIKETALRLRLSRLLDPKSQLALIKKCETGPIKSAADLERIVPESWRANPDKVLMIVFMLQSFYVTHFPKQLDTDRLPKLLPRLRFDPSNGKSIIQYSGKPPKENGNGGNGTTMNVPTKKKKIAEKSGVIYAQFIQAKALITLFTKYILKYYYLLEGGKDSPKFRFWNLFIHLTRGLFTETSELNFLDRGFQMAKFQEMESENNSNISTQMDQLAAGIFGSFLGQGMGTGSGNIITQIYDEVWKGDQGEAKRELLRMSENSPENFMAFFKKLFGRKYMVYLAEGDVNNIGRFGGITSRVNLQKPSFYSIHKLRLGTEEAARFNSLLLRTKWNGNAGGNKNKNTLNNYQIIKGKNREKRYNAETKKQLIAQMLEKMANENQIAGNIKKNNASFVWTEGMGPKMKQGLELEIFILLTYKKYLRNIFRLLTSRMDPLAVEVLAKV